MAGLGYRLYFGGQAATREQLDHVEEIVVEQEEDMAWEARIKLYMCLDDSGRWRNAAGSVAKPFSRLRVEVVIGERVVPLIDGPVAGNTTTLDSQPGRSSVALVVRDDSVLMNRKEGVEIFKDRTDHDIASEVFRRFFPMTASRVESTSGPARTAVRRGTEIQFLRQLARANQFHACVLPGEMPGKSVGCFFPSPRTPGTLPELVLLGPDRNLAEVEVREDSEGPERTRAQTLRISDQRVVSSETSVRNLDLMRPLPPISDEAAALRQLPPEDNDREDPESRTHAQARASSYAYRVTGKVVPGCYGGVLSPYQRVKVKTGNLPLSGDWLLTKVTHRITPNIYTQEFEAKCDSRHDTESGQTGFPAGLSIF